MKLSIATSALVVAVGAGPAYAQSVMVSGDVGFGRANSTTAVTQLAMNGALSFIVNGSAEKDAAILVPIGVEFRKDGATTDILGSGEVAFRSHNVAFGPGGTFGYIFRDDVPDSSCPVSGAIPSGSGCLAGDKRGLRDGGVLYGLGISGYVRVGFGPQRRGFVQARMIFYVPSFVVFEPGSVFASTQTGIALPVPTDFPGFESGRDFRVAGGWVFGTATQSAKFIKAQLSSRVMNFTREKANVRGIYDLSRWQLTFGGGVAF